MTEHNYTEVRLHPEAVARGNAMDLGIMVMEHLIEHGKPVVVFVTEDLEHGKPWVTDNETNANRRGKGQ